MNYLLDTDTCINLIKKNPLPLKKLRQLRSATVFISTISEGELWYGIAKSQKKDENAKTLKEFLMFFHRLPFTSLDAEWYGQIRGDLHRKGKIIGGNDLLIAAQAVAQELILITGNEKEFKRVSGIKMENWLKN